MSMSSSEFAGREALTKTAHGIPESEYTRRLSDRQQQLASIRDLHRRLWTILIAATMAGIVVACVTLWSHSITALWILLPLVVILSTIQSLAKNARIHGRVRRIVSFYDLGVARLRDQWRGRGISGEEFLPDRHAYASDLDLFGAGSVFELLCTARTGIGRAMLAKWLLHPAERAEIAERQQAVAELRNMLIYGKSGRLSKEEHWMKRRIGSGMGGRPGYYLSVACAGTGDHPANRAHRPGNSGGGRGVRPSLDLGCRRSRCA